jgi:Domain of unknown function (DUF1918)
MSAARKTPAKRTAATKTAAKKRTTKEPRTTPKRTAAKRGDVILIDSVHVGSPPREGEVLKIVRGEISISYWVRWADGHESFITPNAESVRIAPAQKG